MATFTLLEPEGDILNLRTKINPRGPATPDNVYVFQALNREDVNDMLNTRQAFVVAANQLQEALASPVATVEQIQRANHNERAAFENYVTKLYVYASRGVMRHPGLVALPMSLTHLFNGLTRQYISN